MNTQEQYDFLVGQLHLAVTRRPHVEGPITQEQIEEALVKVAPGFSVKGLFAAGERSRATAAETEAFTDSVHAFGNSINPKSSIEDKVLYLKTFLAVKATSPQWGDNPGMDTREVNLVLAQIGETTLEDIVYRGIQGLGVKYPKVPAPRRQRGLVEMLQQALDEASVAEDTAYVDD